MEIPNNRLGLVAQIVSAYVAHNPVSANDLPGFIKSVDMTLTGLNGEGGITKTDQQAAVSIKKSVTPEYLICLEDGKKLKMLKRYLRTQYGLTPDEYRAKWGLPRDYPMVAANYAEQRSQFAKKIGLGRHKSAGRGRR